MSMLRWFLSHEWKSRVRSSFWQKNLALNILLGLLALYFALNLLVLGFFMGNLFRELYPGEPVIEVMNRFVLYYLLMDLLFRVFLQEFPLVDLQRYLLLPISRRRLFHFLLLKSIPNFFNLLPLLLLLPFFFREVLPAQSAAVAITWLVLSLLLLLINHYLAFFLKRIFTLQPLVVLGLVAAISGLFYLDQAGFVPLSKGFGQAMNQAMQQPFLLLIPIAVLVGIYLFLIRLFSRFAYLDSLVRRRQASAAGGQNFALLERLGRIGQLIRLDIQLVLRNKRPKTMISMGFIFLLYPFIFIDDGIDGRMGIIIFVGVIVTGMLMAMYGQFLLSWESTFFDLLMGRQFSMREYYESKFVLFLIVNSVFTLISLAYGFVDWRLSVLFLAVGLYNMGVNSFITLFFSTFNTKRIDPDKQAFFNYQGVTGMQFLYTVPLFVGPILIHLPFSLAGYSYLGVLTIAALGIIGILFKNPLLDWITQQFNSRRYRIISGFKQQA